MKKYILIAFTSLILAGCSGDDGWSTAATGLDLVETSRYQISVPASWSQVLAEDLNSPAAGEFELGYRSEIPRQWFYNNLVILSESREGTKTTLQFVDGVVVRDARQYTSFESLEKDLIRLADGQDTIVHTFRARYNAVTGEYIYLQSGSLCDDKAYIITIGLHTDTSEEDLSRYKSIIQSFTCLSRLQNNNS